MFSPRLRLLRPAIHILIILGIFLITYHLRFYTDLIPGIQLKIPGIIWIELVIFSIFSSTIFILIWIVKKLYELHKPTQKHFQTFTKTRVYWFITITFVAYFWQSFIFKWWISRFIIVLTGFLTFFTLFFFDQIRNYLESKSNKNSPHKMLIITKDNQQSYKTIENIKKWFSFKSELININDINDIKLDKYLIIIAVWNFDKQVLQNLFEKIRLTETRFFHISEWYFLEDVVYSPENIDKIIALEYKHSELDWRSVVLKRALDITLSSIWIILSIPITIITAIAIKIDSKWPIFYIQKRIGKNTNSFTLIKFRSMFTEDCIWPKYGWENARNKRQKLINSDANIRKWELQKINNDPRVTRVWKILRKISLDELPNLFSVLIWTMSIVWPRPHMPHEIKKYKNRQKRLLSIKPGITGYAQIYWRDNLNFDDEARLDLYYIQHRSIFLDLYIILWTLWVVFKWK